MKKSEIVATSSFKLNQGFITQKINKKTTIFSGEDSILYTLNETAALIFNGIKLGWDKNKIAQKLTDKYGIEQKKAFQDINALLDELLSKKIISES